MTHPITSLGLISLYAILGSSAVSGLVAMVIGHFVGFPLAMVVFTLTMLLHILILNRWAGSVLDVLDPMERQP